MVEPDEWLMMQVSKGSAEHLDPLIRRHANAVLAFTTRLLGSVHRGEEVFQEVFLAVWSRRLTYHYPRFFRPWLYGIALNKCREFLRHQDYRTVHYEGDLEPAALSPARPPSSFVAPADAAIATETSTIVEKAVARLPEQQRAILVMRIWNNMSYSEIAEALGVYESTVRSGMHYALINARRYLEPNLRHFM